MSPENTIREVKRKLAKKDSRCPWCDDTGHRRGYIGNGSDRCPCKDFDEEELEPQLVPVNDVEPEAPWSDQEAKMNKQRDDMLRQMFE